MLHKPRKLSAFASSTYTFVGFRGGAAVHGCQHASVSDGDLIVDRGLYHGRVAAGGTLISEPEHEVPGGPFKIGDHIVPPKIDHGPP